ncbi:helix-turn-helix domain-containing protein [Chitinophaga arvensicola]|uniref:Helix-turn-helix n=1 Tax=Chitinophaga arvensicola TaxID=29529 RepID=A0A1I0QLM2_9BACT|nr:helix-turn-helix transcriptional regulator [Chitinophaga arvensicola]SEW27629.1 Helix-turn-helix [Chitinophaga arvensicola]
MLQYNRRFIRIIRHSLKLTQEELGAIIGITRECFGTYERGERSASNFFCDRILELYGIDLRQPPDFHKIVFKETDKVPPAVYAYLSGLEIREGKEE